jgi:hypothetical protein
MNPNEKIPKNPLIFLCEKCAYTTSNKKDWNKHISTRKHIILTNPNEKSPDEMHECICGKIYKHLSSLCAHKKKCIIKNEKELENNKNYSVDIIDSSENEMKILTNLVLEIVKNNTELQKQNQDFQKQMLEAYQNSNNTTVNSNNTTVNNNKTFNLQVFLNEKCKDAMNLSDFVKSFKLQLSDLELVGDEGFINGMTKVIVSKLNGMDENTRPFHCTDLKRETIYVKEDDVWVREGPDNSKLAAAIKAIGHQNFFILKEYKALHPDCESTYSEYNDHYMNLIMKSAGCQKEDIAKVIKKLVKEIVIVK